MSNRTDITRLTSVQGTVHSLPSSKSLSNRALIINALMQNRGTINNISSARDTQLMQFLLATPDYVINVMDAGTTMRFLTAYFAVTGQSKLLTGTNRMKERPIHLLVDALKTLGVTIDYKEKEGFPPIEIRDFPRQLTDTIAIRGDVSSQFISALMMVGPALPMGLTILLEGKVGSQPYLMMTAELMGRFGIRPEISDHKIRIASGQYAPASYQVEPDWSAASYWFAFVALAETATILLPGVRSKALQGDRVIVDIMDRLGVHADFKEEGLMLTKKPPTVGTLVWDFSNCPDLAQTVLPVCAALKIPGEFMGLESLRIKETDRIAALKKELAKIGSSLTEKNDRWELLPGKSLTDFKAISINTYHDHRMAMGFAAWATLTDLEIDDPEVVQKSYPGFWDDMKELGLILNPSPRERDF